MRRLLTICVALCLASCDVVFDLERERYGAAPLYSAHEDVLDQDSLPELVVLDRTPGAYRFHAVYGDSTKPFGERLVTIPLSFRPLAYALVSIRFAPVPSVVVVGEHANGDSGLALLRQQTSTVFDPPIEFSLAEDRGAISAVSSILSVNGEFVLGLIAGPTVLITRPFTLDEPTIELIELDTVTRTAALARTASSLWVVDDDHATEIPIGSDGTHGVPVRQDWPSTPSDRRLVSTHPNFSGTGGVHAFSTRCDGGMCTLTWDALSATAPLARDVRTLDHAEVTQLVISELGDGDSGTDLGIFGLQADGDELATLVLDNTYANATFGTSSNKRVFPRTACPELGEVVAMGTARTAAAGAARSLVLLDRTGRGHAVHPTGPCSPIALQLP